MSDKKIIFGLTLNIALLLINSNTAKSQELNSDQYIFDNEGRAVNTNSQIITAPPSGRMVAGTLPIPNPSVINLDGPNISIDIDNMNSKAVLEYIAEQGEYDLVFVKSNPTYAGSSGNRTNPLNSIGPEGTQSAIYPLSNEEPTMQPESGGAGDDSEESSSLDSDRLISMKLRNKSFSQAFNSVLTASGLQAAYKNGIIYVGPDIVQKAVGRRVSKTYRLNQVSAQSAAQYLGNLGASMTYTNTVTTAVSTGVAAQSAVSSGSTANTTQTSTSAQVLTYGSSVGPLLGLSGTTDDRLSQVTIIGDEDIVNLAGEFLKRLDLRSRQVALTIKIYDVDVTDNEALSSQLALADGKSIITSDPVNSNVGVVISPESEAQYQGRYVPGVIANPFVTSESKEVIGSDGDTLTAESGIYARGQQDIIYATFEALTTSKSSKLLASPTILLVEDNSGASSSGSSSGSLPTNQGSIFVGENVITGLEPVENTSACRQTFSQVGLDLLTTLNKVDDNGFITFRISPTLTAPDTTVSVPGCGSQTIVTTSERRFRSGTNRVRNGETMILTGVISERNTRLEKKVPLLGDLPLLGSLFRSSSDDKKTKELVITVTPKIVDDSEAYGYYSPKDPGIRSKVITF